MSVKHEITIYRLNEEDNPTQKLVVQSAEWNNADFILLVFGRKRIEVLAEDLRRAIQNCTNVRR